MSAKAFEKAFADYVGAKYAIALCNGTATLHTALVAMGVRPGDRVAVPPLTMSSTTIAVLHAGAVPVFVDVDPDTWLMKLDPDRETVVQLPVSLYGLHMDWCGSADIDDAAQTLRPHGGAAFTSFSFQASKILPLGEGGMLCTDSDELAEKARSFASLGYRMPIDKAKLKHPTYERHHTLGWNYRLSPLVAAEALRQRNDQLRLWDQYKAVRQMCADLYRNVVQGCEWLTPQKVPEGFTHDYWAYTVATDTPERCLWLLDAMERHGGERPYPAWRLTYNEPAFAAPFEMNRGTCPVAEDLQPRLVQFQTNNIASAEKNATALRRAIEEAG